MCAYVLQGHALLLQKRSWSFSTAASTTSHIKWPVTLIVSPAAVMKARTEIKNQCHMKCNTEIALLYISMKECGYCTILGILSSCHICIHNYIS